MANPRKVRAIFLSGWKSDDRTVELLARIGRFDRYCGTASLQLASELRGASCKLAVRFRLPGLDTAFPPAQVLYVGDLRRRVAALGGVLSAVAVLELIGPIAVQAALSLADERTLDGASRKPEVR